MIKTNSPDNALRDNIEIWRFKATVDRDTDELTRAVLKTVIFTAEHLLQQQAMLLPHISRFFITQYTRGSSSPEEIDLEVGDSSIKFSSRWLLHQPIIYLETQKNWHHFVPERRPPHCFILGTWHYM